MDFTRVVHRILAVVERRERIRKYYLLYPPGSAADCPYAKHIVTRLWEKKCTVFTPCGRYPLRVW